MSSYPDTASRSALLFERARRVLPGGNTRTTVYSSPYPLYAVSGSGCRVVDADGTSRIDYLNNYTALIHGHAHPDILAAVQRQLPYGTCFGLPTESEIRLAELLCKRVPSFERIRFMNSGSEAVMNAIKAARAYTGRSKIAKVEGAYHGSYDFAEVSEDSTPANWGEGEPAGIPYSRGTPPSVLEEVVVIPFNDAAAAERILGRHAGELAAVLVDPLPLRVGLMPADHAFLRTLRDFTRRAGAVLIFDEVISFRIGYHGAQGEFGVEPDLTTLGKIIGGGFPVGAVAGRAEVMAVFDPTQGKPLLPHGGTFNANPITMTAGAAAMELLTPEAFARLSDLGERARAELQRAFSVAGVPGQVTGMGSLLRIHMTSRRLVDYRSAFPTPEERERQAALHRYLLNHGLLLGTTGLAALSTPMGEAEIDHLAATVLQGLRSLA